MSFTVLMENYRKFLGEYKKNVDHIGEVGVSLMKHDTETKEGKFTSDPESLEYHFHDLKRVTERVLDSPSSSGGSNMTPYEMRRVMHHLLLTLHHIALPKTLSWLVNNDGNNNDGTGFKYVRNTVDVYLKTHNAANRVQASSGLRRPASNGSSKSASYVDFNTVARLLYYRGGGFARLFLFDKTGIGGTPPSIVPLRNGYNGEGELMCLYLHAVSRLDERGVHVFPNEVSNKGHVGRSEWVSPSRDLHRFLLDLTGLPKCMFHRQHFLRNLFLNEVALEHGYSMETMESAGILTRNEPGQIQSDYIRWTRLYHHYSDPSPTVPSVAVNFPSRFAASLGHKTMDMYFRTRNVCAALAEAILYLDRQYIPLPEVRHNHLSRFLGSHTTEERHRGNVPPSTDPKTKNREDMWWVVAMVSRSDMEKEKENQPKVYEAELPPTSLFPWLVVSPSSNGQSNVSYHDVATLFLELRGILMTEQEVPDIMFLTLPRIQAYPWTRWGDLLREEEGAIVRLAPYSYSGPTQPLTHERFEEVVRFLKEAVSQNNHRLILKFLGCPIRGNNKVESAREVATAICRSSDLWTKLTAIEPLWTVLNPHEKKNLPFSVATALEEFLGLFIDGAQREVESVPELMGRHPLVNIRQPTINTLIDTFGVKLNSRQKGDLLLSRKKVWDTLSDPKNTDVQKELLDQLKGVKGQKSRENVVASIIASYVRRTVPKDVAESVVSPNSGVYIGIDASPLCVAVAVLTIPYGDTKASLGLTYWCERSKAILESSGLAPNITLQSKGMVMKGTERADYFELVCDHVVNAAQTELSSRTNFPTRNNERHDSPPICVCAVEAPLLPSKFVDSSQSMYVKQLMEHMEKRLQSCDVQVLFEKEAKPMRVRHFWTEAFGTKKKKPTEGDRTTIKRENHNAFVGFLHHYPSLQLDEDNKRSLPLWCRKRSEVRKGSEVANHPMSDVVDATAVAFFLSEKAKYRPTTISRS